MQRLTRMLLLTAVLAVSFASLSVTMAQGANLLQDPGFEGEYTNRGRADLNIPQPWGLWFTETPHNEYWQNLPPVAFPHPGPGPNPHGGARALNFNKGFGTFTAAVYQQVSVPQGANVTGSAWGHLRTCNVPAGSEVCGSAMESGAFTRVGIDPNGGTNPYDSDVIWSPNATPHDRWDLMTVSATSTGTTVTLFLFSTQAWPAQINSTYWDDASLSIGGAGGVAPSAGTPPPGSAPVATVPPPPPAFVGFVTAQTPQPDGSIIHIIQAGDTIDSIAVAYGLTRAQLLALNPTVNARFIQIGQELLVREATGEATQEAESTQDAESTAEAGSENAPQATNTPRPRPTLFVVGPETYFVQPGETLESIALKFDLVLEELMELNNLEADAVLEAGQPIMLFEPAGGRPQTSGTAQSTPAAGRTQAATPQPTATTRQNTFSQQDAPPAPIVSVASGAVLPAIDPAVGSAAVCVFLFRDLNQNRLQEMGEDLLADGTITLSRSGEVVDTYTTDGLSEPYCFRDLEAGDYVASAAAPEGYGLTTADQLQVSAAAGTDVTLAFGAAEGVAVAVLPPDESAAVTPAGNEDNPSTTPFLDASNPLTDNLGLVVFGAAAVVLVVGMGTSLALRRR